MKIQRLIVGELDTNCYLLSNDNGNGLVIDPGADGQDIIAEIEDNEFTPCAILLTHGHYDHIGGVNAIVENFNIPVYAHQKEIEMLFNPQKNMSAFFQQPVSIYAEPITGDILAEFGFDKLEIIHIPGHTEGSIGIIGDGFFISGDTVFSGGGIGITDIPAGNLEQLIRSIEVIIKLPDELTLYPGHGGRSTLGREKKLWRQAIRMFNEGMM